MEKIGTIRLIAADNGPTITLDLSHGDSNMPGFHMQVGEERIEWQLNPDSVVAILNLLNDSMVMMMRTMAIEYYQMNPDNPIVIKRPTDEENVLPFKRN